jgi:hypothetical protein
MFSIPGDPLLGRVKAKAVPPPHALDTLRRSLARFEQVNDYTLTSVFLTLSSQSPLDDAGKVDILSRNGPGSAPHEPLAFVVKSSDSERRDIQSEGDVGLSDGDAGSPETRYRMFLPCFVVIASCNVSAVTRSLLPIMFRVR